MTARNPVTEQDLEEVFKDDPDFGIRLLHEDFREVILRYIKKHGWGLQLADWMDIYSQTILEMIQKSREPGFDHRKPLALAFHIAKCRTRDMLRRRKHRANPDTDAILDCVAKDFSESDIGIKLRYPDSVVWEEFQQNLYEVIAALPGRQRIVARVFIDNYEDFRERDTYTPLAELVSNITGKPESVVAKQKIVKELTRRGFNFLEAE